MRRILIFLVFATSIFALPFDDTIKTGVLENGLKYYVKESKNPKNTAYFQLIVRVGSADEAESESGLAHFVEHMAFNGSRDFAKNDLIKQLESLGVAFGADLNAQTGYDSTSYDLQITVSEANLKSVMKVFSNWIDGVSFDSVELEKERGVIIEEARSRDTPGYRLFKQRAKNLYEGSVYDEKFPIGDMNVVKNVTREQIKGFYDRLYQPRLMEFIAVGDFDANKIETLIKQSFSAAKNTNDYKSPDKTIPIKSGMGIYNYDTHEVGINTISLSFFEKFRPIISEADVRTDILNLYIQQLFSMIYEQKAQLYDSPIRANFASSSVQAQNLMHTFGVNVVGGDYESSLSDMLGVIEGVRIKGFDVDDFASVKKELISNVKNEFLQLKNKKSQEHLGRITDALDNGSALIDEKAMFELNLKLLDEITLDEINAEFRRILELDGAQLGVFSSSGFKMDEAKFNEIKASVKPYDAADSLYLPDNFINEGELVEREILTKQIDEERQIYTYKFNNGATAILKPLKTHKNEVLFAAVSRGGSSNLPKPKEGGFAAEVSNESGAGPYNNYQLSKIASGKEIGYEKRIDPLAHGFYGRSGTADLRHLLGAIYLEFNSPRLSANILTQIKARMIERLSKSEPLPEFKFKRELAKFIYDENPRALPLSKADVDALELTNLTKIVEGKFTNAASFDFIFVGDFEFEEIEPLLKRYIANLPTRNERENYVDDGIRTIEGVHKFERGYQTTQRSDVNIKFKNEQVRYSKPALMKAQAMAAVLGAMLRENIREDKGETYGFTVVSELKKVPYEHSAADIRFTCSPKNSAQIIADIKRIIAQLKTSGDRGKHLENYKKSALLKLRRIYVEPDFWLQDIINKSLYDDEYFDLARYEQIIGAITNEDIKEAAKLYLNDENMIISINKPAW